MKKLILFASLLLSFQSSYSQYVILGTGTGPSLFSPLSRREDYSVYEIVYLQSQINMAGTIQALDIHRMDGDNTDSIVDVRIYMMHSTATSLSDANFDTTGYTLVYTGSFPNDAGTGWRGVQLDTPFVYNNLSNLQVIILKGYQAGLPNTPVAPRWYYTNTTPVSRARRDYGSTPITSSTLLTTTVFASNMRLAFNSVSVVEIGNESSLKVYPNPTQSNFSIECPDNITSSKLSILDIKGAVVFEQTIKADEKLITPEFSTGMYFLLMTDPYGKALFKTKLVVE